MLKEEEKKEKIKTHVSPPSLFPQTARVNHLFSIPALPLFSVHYPTTRIVQKQVFHVRAHRTFMQHSFYKAKS
jgi:hypothetical protein